MLSAAANRARRLQSAFRRADSVTRRISFGVIANAASKAASLILQLITLAVLPRIWGGESFGIWVMLSAIPIYIGLTDLGFGSAAATDMTLHIARGDRAAALEAFQSVWILITAVELIIFAISMVALVAIAVINQAQFSLYIDAFIAAGLLIPYTLLLIQSSILNGVFRAAQKYAEGTLLGSGMLLADGLAIIAAASLGGGFAAAAGSALLVRAVAHAGFTWRLQKAEPWIAFGWSKARWVTIRRLSKPAMGSFGLTASSAIALQGVTVAIGFALSPVAAASFTSARTLCRVPLQMSDIFSRATLPEMTAAYGRGEISRLHTLTALNCATCLAVLLPSSILIALWGREIAERLTGHSVQYEPALFVAMSVGVLALGLWSTISLSLQSLNKHHTISYIYLAAAVAMSMVPGLIIKTQLPHSVTAVSAMIASIEVVVLLLAVVNYIGQTKNLKQAASYGNGSERGKTS